MDRKPRADRSPEEEWQIVQEGIKSGNVSETCRRYGVAPNLLYRWKDEAEQGAKAALGGEALPPPKPKRFAASGNWNGRLTGIVEWLGGCVGKKGWGLRTEERRIITRKATATSNGSIAA
jgi:transposase